jgi:hypothetical protein
MLNYCGSGKLTSMNSGWIYAACYHHRNTKSPKLATLFACCCHLLRLPIYPLFIFDGQERPNRKRGKQVQGNHHWITMAMKEMIDHLGFPWVDVYSPALSWSLLGSQHDHRRLVRPRLSHRRLGCCCVWCNNHLAAVSDTKKYSSCLLTVVCSGDKFSRTESVCVYQADDVASLGLDEDALVLIALLAGGDYLVCPS